MEIPKTITIKEEKFLKKVLEVTDIQPVVQKHIKDWIDNIVEVKYKSNKTTNQKIDELTK